MDILDKDKSQIIKEIATSHNLDLIMLFGSQAKNRAIKESDIDIGVFRKDKEITLNDKVILNGEFAELFKNDKIDISTISSNNPVLMYEILKDGKTLYVKKDNLVNTLRLYSWKLLAESKAFRDHSFSILKNRIASFY